MSYENLEKSAIAAIENAYAPYSKFRVGAAIQTKKGSIFRGANIENASFGCVICAERVALFSAIFAGEREFSAMCVATESKTPSPPCGLCRQVLSEFCTDLKIISLTTKGKKAQYSLKDLFPYPFTKNNLGK